MTTARIVLVILAALFAFLTWKVWSWAARQPPKEAEAAPFTIYGVVLALVILLGPPAACAACIAIYLHL